MSVTNASATNSYMAALGTLWQAGNLLARRVLQDDNGRHLADSREIFARNLKFWLSKRSMRGAELARRLGKKQPVISQWLNLTSAPNVKTVGQIAEILDIPMSELFRENELRPDSPKAISAAPTIEEKERALREVAGFLGLDILRIRPRIASPKDS